MKIEIKRNEVFAPCWEAKTRYVVMKGSAGSGKSFDSAMFYIVRLLSQQGRNLLCIRKTAESNERSTFRELQKAVKRMGLSDYFTFTLRPLLIRCVNGNEVLFGGVNDDTQRERLKSITATSGNITDIWIEEATELSRDDFEIIDDRLRGILPEGLFYQIRLTFNPVSAGHWIKRVFFDIDRDDVTLSHSTYLDNAFCDEGYHRRMMKRKELDPEGYLIYGLGEWGERGGLIFTNYQIKEVSKNVENYDYVRYGQDFGFNHANALLEIGVKDGDIYILRELYVREKTTDEIIALSTEFDKNIPMWCDCAEPDRIVMWRRAGFNARGVVKKPVAFCNDWLKRRRIFIHPDCENTIDEISSWRYQKDKNGDYTDEPVPFHDDAMAALRYACCEWYSKEAVTPPALTSVKRYNFTAEKPRNNTVRGRVMVV